MTDTNSPTPNQGELEQADIFMASIGFLLYPGSDVSRLTATRWYKPNTTALTSGETTTYHVTTDIGLFWCRQFNTLTAQVQAAEVRDEERIKRAEARGRREALADVKRCKLVEKIDGVWHPVVYVESIDRLAALQDTTGEGK